MKTETTARPDSAIKADLAQQVIDAVTSADMNAEIRTPGFQAGSTMTIQALLVDQFAGERDTIFAGLISLWSRMVQAGDPAAVALLQKFAAEHAEFHLDEAALEELDSAEVLS